MARHKPAAASPAEQDADHAARIARDAKATDERQAAALELGNDENSRIRRLQAELGLKQFETLPAAAPLFEIARVLRNNRERIEDERALLSIENYLSGGTGPGLSVPKGPKAQEFAERREQLKKKLKISTVEPAPRPPGVVPPEVKAGLEIFSAGAPKAPQNHAGRLSELADMEIVVDEAIRINAKQIEELRGQVGFEAAKQLQKKHDALCVSLFRASQKLAEAAEAERSLRVAYTSTGFRPRSDLLPAPAILSSILLLGSEADWESQISQYRRFLQQRNLLP
jgi:hypothetical protein